MNTKDPLFEVSAVMAELVEKVDKFAELGLDQARLIHRTRNKLKNEVRHVLEALKSGAEAKKELELLKSGKTYNLDEEREVFEFYLRNKGIMVGCWSVEGGYEDTSTRMLWQVWRYRSELK